jgi:hypothetical protein
MVLMAQLILAAAVAELAEIQGLVVLVAQES